MGYIKHNAIVVTSCDELCLGKAHKKAKKLFNDKLISEVVKGVMNGYISFFIAPDGSKEGWEDSNDCDEAREKFIHWLLKKDRGCDFVEVRFGGDDNQAYIES